MEIASAILQIIYYVLVGICAFLAIFSVYVLVRYGQSQIFSLVLGLIFVLFFILTLASSYNTLQLIIK